MIDFDVKNYVKQYLRIALRKAKMLQFLQALVHAIDQLWVDFRGWRTKQVYDINISGQTYALQEHLNNMFDNTQRRISIVHYNDQGLYIPLESEGYDAVLISLESEDQGQFIALKGEIQEAIGVSFKVYMPIELNKDLILSELYKYKLAGKTFDVIEN